jgi:hypothetical protein
MKERITRGKWIVMPRSGAAGASVHSTDGYLVATVVSRASITETNANARLIGKAPEMKQMLKRCARALCPCDPKMVAKSGHGDGCAAVEIEELIAEIDGEME